MRLFVRLRNALALGMTAATTGTAVLAFACPSAAAHLREPRPEPGPGQRAMAPTCGKASNPDFPLGTRILGGPTVYAPGGGFRTWNVDLSNTTDEPCRDIHPVLALTDRDRNLRAEQIRLDFYDSEARRWRPVSFEETDEDENIGVFTGFPGFAVPAGGTLRVPVRLAFRADTAPNEIVANAAVVQRQGDDGDWVGESEDYRLTVGPADPDADPRPDPRAENESGTGRDGLVPPGGDTRPSPDRPELAATGTTGTTATATTGRRDAAARLAPASAALLLAGAALVITARRRVRP